MNYITPTC